MPPPPPLFVTQLFGRKLPPTVKQSKNRACVCGPWTTHCLGGFQSSIPSLENVYGVGQSSPPPLSLVHDAWITDIFHPPFWHETVRNGTPHSGVQCCMYSIPSIVGGYVVPSYTVELYAVVWHAEPIQTCRVKFRGPTRTSTGMNLPPLHLACLKTT